MLRPIHIASILSQRGDATSPTERAVTSVQSPNPMTVAYNTSFQELILPASVVATLDDGTLVTLPVSWSEGTYDGIIPDTYTLEGTLILPFGVVNPSNIEATIDITVADPVFFDVFGDSVNGDDDTGTGASDAPFETLEKCRDVAVALGGPRAINLAPGDYTIDTFEAWPVNISLYGGGKLNTFITGDASLNYSADLSLGQYGLDKYLFQVTAVSSTDVVLTFQDFEINGDSRAKHGAFYIENCNDVIFRDVIISDFNIAGLYFNGTDNLQIYDCTFNNCSHSTSSLSTGDITFGNNINTRFERVAINEGRGFGVKAYNFSGGQPVITGLLMLRGSISVEPTRLYDPTLSNNTMEFSDCFLVDAEIYENSFDNTVYFATATTQLANYQSGALTLHFHDNTCNLMSRANGFGYAMGLNLHNIEINGNTITGGSNAVFWNRTAAGQPARDNWLIYNNTIINPQSAFPVGIVRTTNTPLNNLRWYNNTVHITGNQAVYVFYSENGQVNFNWAVRNNAILDASTQDSQPAQGGANTFIKLDGGGSITNLLKTHNSVFGMAINTIVGEVANNNITTNPLITLSGASPDPYYRPLPGSPLIAAGINVGVSFTGSAPTIGRYESTTPVTGAIESVEVLADQIVATGTTFANIGLPPTVQVTLDNSVVINCQVTWSAGSYNGAIEDIYPLVGTLVLATGITNPESLTANINIIVGEAIIVHSDSFNRVDTDPGSDYIVEGVMTTVLNGSDMEIDGTDGQLDQRIKVDVPIVGINNFKASIIIEVIEFGATTHGLGIGVQNVVNPDPNKGVFANFWMNSVVTPGHLQILSGNSTTSNTAFLVRTEAPTNIAMALNNTYILSIERTLSGSNLIWTATAKNLITDETNTTQWTEVGAGSLVYEATSYVTIYRFGGLQRIKNIIIQDLETESAFPDVTAVQATSPISVNNGTAFGLNGVGVGLPATRTVTLSDATTPSYSVNWAQGTYAPTTANDYNIVGTIQLPTGVTNIGNIVASVLVTVLPPITGNTTFTYYVDAVTGDDNDNGTSLATAFATIQRAANVAVAGNTIGIRGGTYRETVTPANSGTSVAPITYSVYPGETAVINGCTVVSNSGWSVHSGQVYKKTVTLPVNGYIQNATNNTDIVANQLFKDGAMMIEARYPKVANESQLFDRYKTRSAHLGTNTVTDTFGVAYQPTSITDTAIGSLPSLAGSTVFLFGWFGAGTKTITGKTGNTITFTSHFAGDTNFRKWWYVTNSVGLCTDEYEFHYGTGGGGTAGTLYFRQPGGGSPTGVEFKARNWGFDLRGKTYITIAGLSFFGCEVTGNTSTSNIIIDNIRAKYTNHFVMTEPPGLVWDITRFQSGFRLLGVNNQVVNSEFDMGASACIWVGSNSKVINNKISRYGYDSNYGAGVDIWGNSGNIEISYNTIFQMGRGGVNFPGNNYNHTKFNLNIHHNDIYQYGCLNYDSGAIYTAQRGNTSGSRIHHNWLHNCSSQASPTGHRIQGIFAAIYWDQGTGPAMFDHNVIWNNYDSLPSNQDCADFYILSLEGNRTDTPGSELWNNTFWGAGGGAKFSYVTYLNNPQDTQRNNIYRDRIALNWTNTAGQNYNGGFYIGNTTNSYLAIAGSGGAAGFRGTNYASSVSPGFVGTGSTGNGLDFRLSSGSSAACNIGTTKAGITDGFVGVAPDAGAYEFGDPNPWTAGYTPVVFEAPDPVDPPADTTPYQFEAEEANAIVGGTNFGTFVGSLVGGSSLRFDYDFAAPKDKISIRYARLAAASTTVEVRLGSTSGTLKGTVTLPTTNGNSTYATVDQNLSSAIAAGTGSIFLVFPSGTDATNLDWIEFIVSNTAGNIATLDSVSNFSVPYDTPFGTNGAGLGSLPTTVNCTFTGGATGTVDLTWAIGSYSQSAAKYASVGYTIVGTPILTGGITNSGNVTVSVTVTVNTPWSALANTPALLLDAGGLVTNTTNSYGVVNGSGGVTQWSDLSGNGRHFTSQGTAPILSGGRISFIGTGYYMESAGSTAFLFMQYNATPANLKWTTIMDVNVTSGTGLLGLMGNNGFYYGARGFTIGIDRSNNSFLTFVFNGTDQAGSIAWGNSSVMTLGTSQIITSRIDNSLVAAAGKVRAYKGTTAYNATSSGTGTLNNSASATKLQIGDYGSSGGNDFTGSMKFVCILGGVETDAVLAKLQSDIATITGTAL